jgi:tetraacyldisaccharide 4'-kinase
MNFLKIKLNLLLQQAWYKTHLVWWLFFLVPFSWIYAFVVYLRRYIYLSGMINRSQLSIPVIVIGNITVGGTGKTPVVIALARWLEQHGYSPAIISRGAGSSQTCHEVILVDNACTIAQVGDEALMMKQVLSCPIVVCSRRTKAVEWIQQNTKCQIILSDDGLQHYQMHRQLEIVIVDTQRMWGNGYLIPAGPLREDSSRLSQASAIFLYPQYMPLNQLSIPQFHVIHSFDQCYLLNSPEKYVALNTLANKSVHVVTAIGNPERFISQCEGLGMKVIAHIFPDHYTYQLADLQFEDNVPLVMTAKDAIKCIKWANSLPPIWVVTQRTDISDEFWVWFKQQIDQNLDRKISYV